MLPDCAVSANAVCGNLDRRLQARNAVLRVAPRIVRIYTLRRFRVGACWIGAGIDRYEDELEFPPDSHFSFDSANHRVASDAFIYAGWKALKALRRSTPNG